MEGGILRQGRRCEGYQSIFAKWITKSRPRELLVALYRCMPGTDNIVIEILQGSFDVEIPSTSECPTTGRSDDVENSVRDGIRLDEERKHK